MHLLEFIQYKNYTPNRLIWSVFYIKLLLVYLNVLLICLIVTVLVIIKKTKYRKIDNDIYTIISNVPAKELF